MTEPALSVRGLQHTFHRGAPTESVALRGIDLDLEPGAFVAVLGTNGSGKSTLLNAIAGSLRVNAGSIAVAGTEMTRWPEHRRAKYIARVFQDPFAGTAADLTVAENLAIAVRRGRPRRLVPALTRARREEFQEQARTLGLGLESRLQTPMGMLSGGQRQAMTLLMAMLVRPKLLLLDEHTAALDPRSAEQVLRLTQAFVAASRVTTLMVTHSLAQAVRLGDRILILHRGLVACDLTGAQKRRTRVEDLLDRFEELRREDLLDESAAELLARSYL
jgi:putative tryptophan/tyrosine transport system ATP-binding protein